MYAFYHFVANLELNYLLLGNYEKVCGGLERLNNGLRACFLSLHPGEAYVQLSALYVPSSTSRSSPQAQRVAPEWQVASGVAPLLQRSKLDFRIIFRQDKKTFICFLSILLSQTLLAAMANIIAYIYQTLSWTSFTSSFSLISVGSVCSPFLRPSKSFLYSHYYYSHNFFDTFVSFPVGEVQEKKFRMACKSLISFHSTTTSSRYFS